MDKNFGTPLWIRVFNFIYKYIFYDKEVFVINSLNRTFIF